jgi:hypothetical protein
MAEVDIQNSQSLPTYDATGPVKTNRRTIPDPSSRGEDPKRKSDTERQCRAVVLV